MFIDAVLSDAVAYGFEGGPEYLTDITEQDNGYEHRNSVWMFPRHRYSARFVNIPDEAKTEILAAFHACRGRAHSFKFKDWNDYYVENQRILVPRDTTDTIQLYRTYQFGPVKSVRVIQALKYAELKDNLGNPIEGDLNLNTGEFTPMEPWASDTVYWTGEYYVWVRFDNDYNRFTIGNWQASTAPIDLVEDKRRFTAENVYWEIQE